MRNGNSVLMIVILQYFVIMLLVVVIVAIDDIDRSWSAVMTGILVMAVAVVAKHRALYHMGVR